MIVEDFHAEKAAELMISCGNEDEGGNFAIDISISHCWKHAWHGRCRRGWVEAVSMGLCMGALG